jgi:hypothetical protein
VGGLPWRGDRSTGTIMTTKLAAFEIGKAAITRHAGDDHAAQGALYLAQRMRREGPCLVDAAMGFELAKDVRDALPQDAASVPELAPTDAELHRALALSAVCNKWLIDNDWEELASDQEAARKGTIGDGRLHRAAAEDHPISQIRSQAIRALEELALDAPPDRHHAQDHANAVLAKYEHNWLVLILLSNLPRQLGAMTAAIDAFATTRH